MPINPGADYKIKPQTEEQDALLKQFLQGGDQAYNTAAQGRNAQALATKQEQLKEQGTEHDLGLANDQKVGAGDSIKVGDVLRNRSGEGRLLTQATNGEAQAVKHAQDFYNHGSQKIGDQAQALGELQKQVSNPGQMTLGTARSLVLKTMGMNRYNGDEAKAVLPGTLQGFVGGLFSQAGGDDSTITAEQAKALNQFAGHMGGALKDRHETLKQQALDNFSANPYASQARYGMLKNTLGSAMDKQIAGLGSADMQPAQAQPVSGVKSVTQPAAPGGVLDSLTAWLKGSQGAPAQPATVSTGQAPQRQVVKTEVSPSTGKKRITYSDGTQEIQ